jgi:hypothetical protein
MVPSAVPLTNVELERSLSTLPLLGSPNDLPHQLAFTTQILFSTLDDYPVSELDVLRKGRG